MKNETSWRGIIEGFESWSEAVPDPVTQSAIILAEALEPLMPSDEEEIGWDGIDFTLGSTENGVEVWVAEVDEERISADLKQAVTKDAFMKEKWSLLRYEQQKLITSIQDSLSGADVGDLHFFFEEDDEEENHIIHDIGLFYPKLGAVVWLD